MDDEKIAIDVGSSSVKVYKIKKERTELLFVRSIFFKDGFDPEIGIAKEKKEELFELVEEVKKSYGKCSFKVIATSQFRKLSPEARENFVGEFFKKTGLRFDIISQEMESLYLEKALVGKADVEEPILLVNIGGGSTELILMQGMKAVKKIDLDFGVGTVLNRFHKINEEYSGCTVKDITSFVKEKLPEIKNNVRYAVYTGGELNYMQIAEYNLVANNLFEDKDHPKKISIEDFSLRNEEIFSSMTFKELENKMPENPKWVHGSRACSALAQAIFEKYGINFIIPSDSNIIHGYVREELK
ncbi:MAG: hypothetical protein KAT37_00585 [Candidatus Aenigmarchaeota archaeon]|nr:hypothetical protein [Candidatus Aenigmarchaeota archaeon]